MSTKPTNTPTANFLHTIVSDDLKSGKHQVL